MYDYDVIVIGGGSAGVGFSNRASIRGAKVALIEKQYLGGTCANLGCVPKKISWYAAHILDAVQKYGPGYGVTIEGMKFDYPTFLKARDAYVGRARSNYEKYAVENGVTLYHGYGKLISPHQVEVNGQTISAQYIMVLPGSKPSIPDVKGKELLSTSDDFFAWTQLPQSVLVVGAGYIAVELAGVLNTMGVETKLAVRYDRPLRRFDSMLTTSLMDAMKEAGIDLLTATNIDEYKQNGHLIDCYQEGKVVASVEKVLIAAGRHANTEGLGLEKAGVELDERGYIRVDDNHRTNVEHIYAFGDVIGKVDLTPVAIRAGRQVAEYLFNGAKSGAIDYDMIPTVIFTHPAIATVGLSEEAAIKQYGEDQVKIYQSSFNSMYASAASMQEPSRFKLVCVGEEERVVGLHGIGEGVDEMLQGFALSMKMGARKADFDSVVAIHPTGSEEFVLMR